MSDDYAAAEAARRRRAHRATCSGCAACEHDAESRKDDDQ